MYDTAPRKIAYIVKSSTTEDVGPATYVLCNPRSRKQNCAPFLTRRSKSPSFITKLNTDAIYDVRSFRDKIKGGASLKSKTPRFVYKATETPGPARYNAKPIQWGKKKVKLDPTKPKLYACAVPYSLTDVAPSIPTKIDENGYDLDDKGNIIKVPPDEPEPIDVDIKSQFPGNKGCRWSHRTARRFPVKQYVTLGPGPAAYSVQVPKCRRAEEDERFREMARRFGFIPRYVEAQEMKAVSEAMPGPGSYDIPQSRPLCDRSKGIRPRPFIMSAARFTETTSDTPGPTDYKICDCSGMRKQFSTKCAPFGVEAPRFRRKKLDNLPGPASYEIKSALQAKIDSKRNPYACSQPPFNNTAPRDLNFAPKDAECTPSAAEYPEDKEREDETMEIYSSVFMSAVERFHTPAHKKDTVSPARYNVAASFDKSRDQKSFFVGKVPFHSSGPRSTTPSVKLGVPCPTAYKNERGLGDAGHYFCLSPRFKEEEEKPGPGAYNIHPGFEDSTCKAWSTHNLKLKENVVRKKLRLAPRETRKQWTGLLKKRKLLRWFDVGLDYEERLALLIQKLFDKPV